MSKKRPLAVVLGTRPEIIKLSSIIRHLKQSRQPFFILHTGQHYTYAMDRIFFRSLNLPLPDYQFSVRSGGFRGHAEHVAGMMTQIERVFRKTRPRACFVQGDTNTVLAGSLVAAKMPDVALAHVEAGLRSYDRRMPEEVNRVVADHTADLLFAPTVSAKRILTGENIHPSKIFVTGNTIVDAVRQNLRIAARKVNLSRLIGSRQKLDYALVTLHRPENVDQSGRLRMLLAGVATAVRKHRMRAVFPVHPRTLANMKRFGITLGPEFTPVKPVGFLEFLILQARAGLILSDSGGVQEEACILKVPCVTLRTTTERPETVTCGANIVAGFSRESIAAAAAKMLRARRNWPNPFGDGRSGERMVGIVNRKFPS